MFSEHTSAMNQQLVAAGMNQQQANIIADTIGQCMAKLTHRGPVEMFGPLKLGGRVSGGGDFGLLFNPRNGDAYFQVDHMTGTISQPVVDHTMPRIFSLYTLAADLNASDSVVAGGKTYVNTFCRVGYKLLNGTLVGAINGGNNSWYIIAWNDCEVLQ